MVQYSRCPRHVKRKTPGSRELGRDSVWVCLLLKGRGECNLTGERVAGAIGIEW